MPQSCGGSTLPLRECGVSSLQTLSQVLRGVGSSQRQGPALGGQLSPPTSVGLLFAPSLHVRSYFNILGFETSHMHPASLWGWWCRGTSHRGQEGAAGLVRVASQPADHPKLTIPFMSLGQAGCGARRPLSDPTCTGESSPVLLRAC